MTVRLGMIGLSEGNGHPFSFSSIINGYCDAGLAASGWQVIYDYVRRRDPSDFGFEGVSVTHAWTQDPAVTAKLCAACRIPHVVTTPEEMAGEVDAVVIARDDPESHLPLALPFLERGLHVFVDKPLSLDVAQLKTLRPYLEEGRLMSCSGMRYARELDEARATLPEYGELKLVRGAVLNCWEKYGVHLLDAIFNVVQSRPVSVLALEASHTSVAVSMDDGALLQLDALGAAPKCFRVEIFGSKRHSSHEISDNFSMFRRTLWHFVQSVGTGTPAIDAQRTLDVMRLLIAGRRSAAEKRRVLIDEIGV